MIDLFFFYKNIGRFILYLKYSNKNFHYTDILEFSKLVIFFDIININDLNNVNILSNIFFFRYYFGILPFFTNYNYKFKLNIHYFSFFIQYNFFNENIYFPIFYFLNDVYFMINKSNIAVDKNLNYWKFYTNDMNFFIEKKNTLGFFNLKYKIYFQFFFKKITNLCVDNLLYIMKYKD